MELVNRITSPGNNELLHTQYIINHADNYNNSLSGAQYSNFSPQATPLQLPSTPSTHPPSCTHPSKHQFTPLKSISDPLSSRSRQLFYFTALLALFFMLFKIELNKDEEEGKMCKKNRHSVVR